MELNNTLHDDSQSPESNFAFRQVSLNNDTQLITPTPAIISLDDDFNNTASQESQEDVLNDVESSEEGSAEAFVAPKRKKQCFDVPAAPKNKTEILCSSKKSTPVALPRAWLLMNNLDPDAGPPCKNWKPATGTRSISCVNV